MVQETITLVWHPDCLKHDSGPGHPESPQRISAIIKAADDDLPGIEVSRIMAQPLDESLLLTVHSREHVEHVRAVCATGGYLDPDTHVSADSFRAALLSAGAARQAAESALAGTPAFALCRPPGHHARPEAAMGFCLFNNIALAARYLQRERGVGRLAIVDWDAHHGNGTEEIFLDDPGVSYISLHQQPLYPGTGDRRETGTGTAAGTNLNLPMPPGTSEPEYLSGFDQTVLPAIEGYDPEIILISAGYDGHRDDPLAALNLTAGGFGLMTAALANYLRAHRPGRALMACLEGGYRLQALTESALATMSAMAGVE